MSGKPIWPLTEIHHPYSLEGIAAPVSVSFLHCRWVSTEYNTSEDTKCWVSPALSFLLNKPASAIPCCRWTSLTQSAYSWFEIYQHLPIFNKLLGSWWTINIFLSSDLHVLWTNQSTVRTIGGGGNNLLHPCSHPSPTTIATPSCSPHTLPTRTWTKSQKQRTNKITTHTFGDSEHE